MMGLDPGPLERALFPFCSGKSVVSVGKYIGSVSGVCSGNLFPTGIKSLGDVVLLFMLLPRGFDSKGG